MVLNIELEVNEVNLILKALGKLPFDESAAVIAKVKTQGESQLKVQSVAEAAVPSTE